MKIKYKNYLLTPTDSRRWDFSKIVIKKRIGNGDKRNPNGEEYESEDILGYDMRMESIIEDILMLETVNKLKDETVELKEFIKTYKECKDELIKEFSNNFKIEVK